MLCPSCLTVFVTLMCSEHTLRGLSLCNYLQPPLFPLYYYQIYSSAPSAAYCFKVRHEFHRKGNKRNVTIICIYIYMYTYVRRHMAYSTISKLSRQFIILHSINSTHNTNVTTFLFIVLSVQFVQLTRS